MTLYTAHIDGFVKCTRCKPQQLDTEPLSNLGNTIGALLIIICQMHTELVTITHFPQTILFVLQL